MKRHIVEGLPYLVIAATVLVLYQLYTPIRVAGPSMMPALHVGDVVFVSEAARVAPGQIVLTRVPGRRPVLHRVVGVEPDGSLRTMGDANPVPDSQPVRPQYVAGRVMAVLPLGAALDNWRER